VQVCRYSRRAGAGPSPKPALTSTHGQRR
jgi:hypothetical protein